MMAVRKPALCVAAMGQARRSQLFEASGSMDARGGAYLDSTATGANAE
jgi:hypothetical protein